MYKSKSLIILLMLLLAPALAPANTLPQDKLERVYAATLEVVVKKIEQDSLSYEKPLPMHLVPFHIRNDAYWSIGTAFAIAPNTFVSAAHVFDLHVESLYREFYLRDRDGKVYTPDRISKFAGDRDFIVFSLKDHTVSQYLPTHTAATVNSKVFAVGNAHGEGIVLRDGLYTSNSPEEMDGAWSWMRFSAAASPGNSGGPLLDSEGRVIGIVLRKSESENLNYALPIKEVLDAQDNLATYDTIYGYNLEHLNAQNIDRFKYQRKLPLNFAALNKDLIAAFDKEALRLLDVLLEENKDILFPRGDGVDSILYSNYNAVFPHIIWRHDDGKWHPTKPSEVRRTELDNNGVLQFGKLGETLLFRIRKPDDIDLKRHVSDGQLMMDQLIRTLGYKRQIGSEEIRVTSLGKPVQEHQHRDKYGRQWTIRQWNLEYDDSAVLIMSLPTPGGSVSMLRSSSIALISSHLVDLKVMADFAYVTYYGTFKEWQEYQALGRKQVPPALQKVKLNYKSGERLEFVADDIRFNYDAGLQAITDDSDLKLYMSYFHRGNDVVWDLVRLAVGENKNTMNYFEVVKNLRPSERMSDREKHSWERLVQQEFPFNKTSYYRDRNTFIGMAYTRGEDTASLAQKNRLFSVFYSREGNVEQSEVEGRIDRFVKNLQLAE